MKVVQVGLGGMGNTWLNTVLSSSEVEYAGFVEINDSIAQTQAERHHLDPALIFHTLGEALAVVSPDGVIDVTPPQFHKSVAFAALEAGIPVLSEKPLADSIESATEIVRKADETGVLHMVAQNRRYSIPAQTLKRVLASGEMGAVASVSVEFFKGPHFGGFRDEMPYPLIIDMAIHHFDMLRYFLDSNPVSIYGRSWNPSWSWYKDDACAAVTYTFANNVVTTYDGSWCSTGIETAWNAHWRFDCDRGVIVMRDDQVTRQIRYDELENVGGLRWFKSDPEETIPPVTLEYADQAYLLHEFYQAVTNGKTPATTCQDNLNSLLMVFDAIRSFETGSVVRSGVSLEK
jgi:predicted dehydrogenase